jgi:hypothetical protein
MESKKSENRITSGYMGVSHLVVILDIRFGVFY